MLLHGSFIIGSPGHTMLLTFVHIAVFIVDSVSKSLMV